MRESKHIEIDGHSFEILPLTGRPALKKSYFLAKLVAGVIARIGENVGFSDLISKASGGASGSDNKFSFSAVADYFFSELSETEFMNLSDLLLGQVLYKKSTFPQIWETQLGGDAGLAIELIVNSVEYQFGFFSKLLPKYFAKLLPQTTALPE